MNISDYGSASTEQLRAELVTQCDHLAAEYITLAGAQSDRERAYWHFYDRCDPSDSVAARDKLASSQTLGDAVAIFESKGIIESQKVKVALLRDLLA